MRHALAAFVLTMTVASLAAAEPSPPKAEGGKPVRILFVGNSYTMFHDLPGHIAAFMESKGRKVEGGRYLVGGASLRDHWHHNESNKAGGKPLFDIPEEEAKFLQETAGKTAQRMMRE